MKKYIINDNKKILFLKDNEILFENKKAIRIKLCDEEYKFLIKICKSFSVFGKEELSDETFDILQKNKIIILANNSVINSYGTKYERNELFAYNFFKKKSFENIANKKIMIIGLGGTASIIIEHLLAVGIKNFSIIDYDKVELSNLNRQFIYCESDVGKQKTNICEEYILSKNKNAVVKKYNLMINSKEEVKKIVKREGIDFIVNSADMPPYYIQKNIVEASIELNVPCIFGGVGLFEGVYGPLLTNKFNKKKYLKSISEILKKINYIYPCKSSFGVTNSLIATYMSWDIIMYLLNEKKHVKSLNKSVTINFNMEEI
ncbi:MAG: ThiF family adenylyltransferase [Clostridium sp.]|nr:ThiF family adenylyltransferase [Clostridium sp.]